MTFIQNFLPSNSILARLLEIMMLNLKKSICILPRNLGFLEIVTKTVLLSGQNY